VTANSTQLRLPFSLTEDQNASAMDKVRTKGQENKLDHEDRAVHDWYRFVLSYPPHLVRDYISDKFVMVNQSAIIPSPNLVETKIPDATPGIINKYALNDEQALLARLRYNRLIDIFTGLTCYSLQNHFRTTVPDIGQVETDEIYIGIDKRGVHYVLPVQAKVGKDKIGIVQIEQDLAICGAKFPTLVCRSIAAQLMPNDLIALFEFELTDQGVGVSSERHYRLVRQEELSSEELERYKRRIE